MLRRYDNAGSGGLDTGFRRYDRGDAESGNDTNREIGVAKVVYLRHENH